MPKVLEFIPKPQTCNICNKPVEPYIAVTDQDGKQFTRNAMCSRCALEEARKPPKKPPKA